MTEKRPDTLKREQQKDLEAQLEIKQLLGLPKSYFLLKTLKELQDGLKLGVAVPIVPPKKKRWTYP